MATYSGTRRRLVLMRFLCVHADISISSLGRGRASICHSGSLSEMLGLSPGKKVDKEMLLLGRREKLNRGVGLRKWESWGEKAILLIEFL